MFGKALAIGLLGGALFSVSACGGSEPAPAEASAQRGPPLDFEYSDGSDVVFDSRGTRGRATVVVLITTYDMGSQLLLRRVEDVVRTHRPRANAGAVVMEAPKYGVLIDTYREAMELSFPIVLADLATREGRGPFGEVPVLPVLFVLDAEGRVVLRHDGPAESDQIAKALTEASPPGRGKP